MGRKRVSARVRANRLNAKKSTGPKTQAGKKRSSYNSFLHGLSSNETEFYSHPYKEEFIKLLCGGDHRPPLIEAAKELSDAQFWLITIRRYTLILQSLKSRGLNTPIPASTLLDDPVVSEFMEYMSTDEPAFFFGGSRKKSDYRFQQRIINFIFKRSKRSKDPDLERKKLFRYEKIAIKRRLLAIEKFDDLCSHLSSYTFD